MGKCSVCRSLRQLRRTVLAKGRGFVLPQEPPIVFKNVISHAAVYQVVSLLEIPCWFIKHCVIYYIIQSWQWQNYNTNWKIYYLFSTLTTWRFPRVTSCITLFTNNTAGLTIIQFSSCKCVHTVFFVKQFLFNVKIKTFCIRNNNILIF